MSKTGNKKIVVIGSTVTDLVARSNRLPIPGQTILGEKFFMTPGGKGANQAVAAARLGGDVVFISKVGKDSFGDFVLNYIQKDKVDVSHVIRDNENHSGVSLIVLLDRGENAILMTPGSNMKLETNELKGLEKILKIAAVLLVQLEIPIKVVSHALKMAKKHGLITILDPAPARALSDTILVNSDIITPNEHELEYLAKWGTDYIEDINMASSNLLDRGVKNVICTKKEGAYLTRKADDSNTEFFPGIKVDAVDSTGAGDAFAGALAYYLCKGDSLENSIRFANIAAGISVTKYGAMPSFPTLKEVEEYIRQVKG
jgi:ribokinase